MAVIVDTNEFKLKIDQNFKKTPIFKFNDEYFGLAWLEGEHRPHKHDRDEVFLVLEGHLTIEVDGRIMDAGPDMAILIKAGEVHMSKATRKTLVAVFEPQNIGIEYMD